MNFLTVKKTAKLLRRGEPGRHFDGLGLYLVVENERNASWARRYELNHKAHEIGLGSAFAFTLAEARERNRRISQLLADGLDPLAQKRAQRAAQAAAAVKVMTFKEAAQAYVAAHQAKWRSAKHGAQWLSSLQRFVYPVIGALDVAAVDTPAVLRVLEQKVPAQLGHPGGTLWTARAVTADRVRSRIELVLSWAAGRGYRAKENPARWSDLKHVLPEPSKTARVVHHAAVPYQELPALVAELRQRDGVAVKALEFLILTAARAGEALGATWDEINVTEAVWTIPPERMKGAKEHRVPLSQAAIALLRGLYREEGNPRLFLGPRQERLSHAALVAALHRLGRTETVHGMRSAFSDFAHERTAHAGYTIELSLAHSVGGAVEKAYRRGDLFEKRRKLIESWSAFCTSPPVKQSGAVVALRDARP
jgi:integrase